jgi:hypothetical protein
MSPQTTWTLSRYVEAHGPRGGSQVASRLTIIGVRLVSLYVSAVQIDALATSISAFAGGVVLVSHDSRLIENAGCALWVCENQGCREFEGGLQEYRERIIEVRPALLWSQIASSCTVIAGPSVTFVLTPRLLHPWTGDRVA